jgi:hypothetical protein
MPVSSQWLPVRPPYPDFFVIKNKMLLTTDI